MRFIVIVFLIISFNVYSKESCDEESLGLKSSEKAEKLFYTGTCHYRNEDYGLAVKNWEKLSALEEVDPELEELTIDVLNNLGYMKFFGFGTAQNQTQAMEYWKKAILMGHEEAEYHLCHAYADRKQSTFHLAKARKHCKKALLIYKGRDIQDDEILEDIQSYLRKINA